MLQKAFKSACALALVLALAGCDKTLAQLAADIARSEHSDSASVRAAIAESAARSGGKEKEIAQDWAKYAPKRPVGTAVSSVTATDFLPELRLNRQGTDLTRRIDAILEGSKANEILAASVCSLATDTLKTGHFPSSDDIFVEVVFSALGEHISSVELSRTVNDISETFREAQDGQVRQVRLDLLKLRYC
jgi:hypothetical protein